MPERFNEQNVRSRLVARMFNRGLVENRWRGDLVKELVQSSLEPEGWTLCSGDWTSWDLKQEVSSLKIQVKQTARRQTWGLSPQTNRYSIKLAKGFYSGSDWNALAEPQRLAEIYIFAHHPVEDEKTADHWDAQQWRFHVVAEATLPPGKLSISMTDVARLAEPIGIDDLAQAVRQLASSTSPNGRADGATLAPSEDGDVGEAPGGSL